MPLLPHHTPGLLEAGIDEAGRGCLAGPVVAAAVILPPHFFHPLLDDSKKLNAATRAALRPIIEEKALAWAVAFIGPEEIDRINILQATFKAMHRAVDGLFLRPEALLVDGNRALPYPGTPHNCIVRGDGLYAAIAAASVLAKTHRDAYMEDLHAGYPQYGWAQNKGYPSAAHRAAVYAHGRSPHHRTTFRCELRISEAD